MPTPAHDVRDHLLAGIWGREVHHVDKQHKYVRAPVAANRPLSMWSNRWSTMPMHARPEFRLAPPDRRARIDFMPGSEASVLRQPYEAGDTLPMWDRFAEFSGHHLWDLQADPGETEDLADNGPLALDYADRLQQALAAIDAPDDQGVRLGF